MKETLYKILGMSPPKQSQFSSFFTNYSSKEKKKIVKKAVGEANKEQKAMVDKYRERYAN